MDQPTVCAAALVTVMVLPDIVCYECVYGAQVFIVS